MIDEPAYISEMQALIRSAFGAMTTQHPDAEIYTISIWTDERTRKSAVSFDTFAHSQAMCRAANATWQQLRERFVSEGDDRRLSLVPSDKLRNNNPADFEFPKIAISDNASLNALIVCDDQAWRMLDRLLEQIKQWAARESACLNLHPDAELGVNGRNTWYGNAIKIPAT